MISGTAGRLGVCVCTYEEYIIWITIAINHTYPFCHSTEPLWAIMRSVDVCSHEAEQQLMVEVPEECMRRHACPLCIGHLALFQCHRAIYISKGDDQEGSLCAPFRTPEMIWFISSSTEIYAFSRAIAPLSSSAHRDGRGSSKKRDLWSSVWSQTQRTAVTVLDSCDAGDFLSAPRLSVLRRRGGGWHNAEQRRLCSWGIRFPRLMEHDRLFSGHIKRPQ